MKKDFYGPEDVTDETLDRVESDVGMGNNAWDCVDPKEIIAAAWNRIGEAQKSQS